MLRSLFSGISSLRSHQTMLDVTGNNIANVNTTGFKAGRTQFQDTLSQMIEAGGAPQAGNGGTNPAQVGLGVQVAGITNDYTPGAAQQTGRALDMMISGDGFFVVQLGGEQLYTRAGAFSLDGNGQLVTAEGAFVQGWTADVGGNVDLNGPLGNVTLPIASIMGAQATTTATFTGNLPADAEDGTVLERTIEVHDADGTARELKVTFTHSDADGWSYSADLDGATSTGSLSFGADGLLTGDPSFAIGGIDSVDLSQLTGFAGLTTVEATSQNGQAAGTLQSFSLNPDGTLIGSFSNGLKQTVAQLAVGNVANTAGMEKAGSSLLRTSVNSGEAQIGIAGTGGRGTLAGNSLEMSNVDLSQEFTNLIIAQRGFQAGSRIITTSDELLQELVNLKR
ncbi:flagellar hook protein FlgE [Georgenia subflava]|uniref:Flagellar hook protein FlgE n=1 Tax=Georgenia subflava TaxID=1622177 RepID=A0A6N7EPF3_9MICO|nr:flagellar hook protein FlgE [Georgenia subflava]MPV38998.1 flagellar hook-basal body complex protein [Georgenia subflava]